MDYSLFYRRSISVDRVTKEVGRYHTFISAFNSSSRVQKVFTDISAARKFWLVHPEYGYAPIEWPREAALITPMVIDEVEQVNAILEAIGNPDGHSICIDITGFMRHVLIFLIPKLFDAGVTSFTALYSEPVSYKSMEATSFSTTTTGRVRPIRGMFGTPGRGKDHLIIAVGYDHQLVSEVSSYKDGVAVHPLFAFPSLSADMYQQSALRAERSGEVVLRPEWVSNRVFAPANDPFSTAGVVSSCVEEIDIRGSDENVFLAPLSTKAQALGIGLYWQLEGRLRSRCTVVLPECLTYSRETSTGMRRLWKYEIELA